MGIITMSPRRGCLSCVFPPRPRRDLSPLHFGEVTPGLPRHRRSPPFRAEFFPQFCTTPLSRPSFTPSTILASSPAGLGTRLLNTARNFTGTQTSLLNCLVFESTPVPTNTISQPPRPNTPTVDGAQGNPTRISHHAPIPLALTGHGAVIPRRLLPGRTRAG